MILRTKSIEGHFGRCYKGRTCKNICGFVLSETVTNYRIYMWIFGVNWSILHKFGDLFLVLYLLNSSMQKTIIIRNPSTFSYKRNKKNNFWLSIFWITGLSGVISKFIYMLSFHFFIQKIKIISEDTYWWSTFWITGLSRIISKLILRILVSNSSTQFWANTINMEVKRTYK